MKRLLALMLCAVSLGVGATAPEGYCISIEEYAVHDAGELAGLTTYRVYLNCVNETDLLSACGGDVDNPLVINTSSGTWYNNIYNASWNASGVNPAFFGAFPELEFDSFLTIGGSTSLGPEVFLFQGSIDLTAEFINDPEPGVPSYGENVTVDDESGAAWFINVPGIEEADTHLAFAGEDLKILIMQITTQGTLSGQAYLQVFPQGDQSQEWRDLLTFDSCCATDADNDGICDDVDSCIDVDADGLCDSTDPCVGAFDNCGVCNGPGPILECGCSELPEGDCDCNGNQVDVLGVCGGSCSADADADGVCDDVDDCVGELDACGVCNGSGEIYECGCANIPVGDCDCEGNTIDLVGVCGGSCTSDHDNNGVCDDQEVFGCAYPLADNYSPEVTHDDGSCVFPCVGEVNANVFDWDGDYSVTVTDFLMMLTVFGDVDVDFDGVWDSADECIDTEACNYDADPSEPCQYIDVLGICGGGCPEDADEDGVCDDVDDCIGVVDECGVCNGPGATEVVIEDITILYDSVYAEQIDTWFVFEVGADTTFSYQCDPSLLFSCGDPVSYQGYDYQTVQIGEQCWFAENLRSENYENGDAIPAGLSDSDWQNTTLGAVTVYGAGSTQCLGSYPCTNACQDVGWSLNEYGRLYNCYAVVDARGLCPYGWHVPTDGEWMMMEMALGMSEVEANDTGWRGADQGTQMKTDLGWCSGDNGANSSGFSGSPGGYRHGSETEFNHAGYHGYWWSSTPLGSSAWSRYLSSFNEGVERRFDDANYGFSVRCLQDTE